MEKNCVKKLILLIFGYLIVTLVLVVTGIYILKWPSLFVFAVFFGFYCDKCILSAALAYIAVVAGLDFLHVKMLAHGVHPADNLLSELYFDWAKETLKASIFIVIGMLLGLQVRIRIELKRTR